MNILASILKSTVKHLNVGEVIQFDTANGVLTTADPSIVVKVFNVLLKDKPATFAVNTRQFLSVVAHLTGEVTMEHTGLTLVVSSGRGRYELNTVSGVQLQARGKQLSRTEVPFKPFYELLAFPASIAEEKQLYNYSGSIQVSPQNGQLVASATDGKRLFRAEAKLMLPSDLLIPVRAVKALREVAADTMFISQDDSAIYFEAGNENNNITITAKKLARNFPDFAHLMPKSARVVHRVKGLDMRAALQRVAPMLDTDEEIQKVRLQFAADKVHVTVKGKGSAEDEIANEQVLPDPMFTDGAFDVTLNHRYLTDFFALTDGNVTFSGVDNLAPVVFSTETHTFLVATCRP